MLIFCGQWSFNSLIQCYRKGNFWKLLWETSFFYSKRHSVPLHILRGSTTNHKFCFNVVAIQYLSSPTISRNDFARSVFVLFKNTLRVVFESKREHTRKSRLAPLQQSVQDELVHSTFLEQEWQLWIKFNREMVLFGRCFGLFSLTVLEKREHIKRSSFVISNGTQFQCTFLKTNQDDKLCLGGFFAIQDL